MKRSKEGRFAEQIRRFRSRFVQSAGAALGQILSVRVLRSAVLDKAGRRRERLYSPLTTLVLFIEQVLGADHHSCQDAVAHGLSARVALARL